MPAFWCRPTRLRLPGLALLVGLLMLATSGEAVAAPTAPTPLTPANSAAVTLPFTISWSQASDPSGILAYNWQVSATSSFAKVLRADSVMAPETRSTVSGLAVGTYFWRVEAVANDFSTSPWSAVRSFRVTGAGAGLPATPVLNQPRGGTSFHPWESFGMSWSGVQGTVKYVLEASKDSSFPSNGVIFRWEQPTPSTDILITTVDRGNYRARVFAVDSAGNYSMPSNVISFSIAFNAPIAAPPTLVSPTGGASAALPITFRWNHVVNPQSSGYHLQIARDSSFSQIEQDIPFLNGPEYTVVQLPTAGTKFWRVRSFQGVIDTAGTAAATAWSAVGSFVVPDAPLRVNSIVLARPAPTSGQEVFVDLQLNKGAPAGGATISLSSSNPSAAPLPASVDVPATHSFVSFVFWTGQVSARTPVTITATIGSESTSQTFTVDPSRLKGLEGMPLRQNGGVGSGGIIQLEGQAPPGGAVVSLTSSNRAAADPPATVTVPAGVESTFFSMPTSQVSQDTPVTITATWRGASVQATTTLTPQPKPTSLTLDPTTTSGASGSFGRVTAADPRSEDVTFSLSSSRPDLARVDNAVVVPQFAAAGGFTIDTVPVSTRTLVTISVSGGGVTLTQTLTLDPVSTAPPPTTLSTFSLSPPTPAAGSSSTGVVTSNQTAPAGGLAVTLSSSNTAVATVPQSVTIPAGASGANFTVATSPSATTRTATITASGGGVTQTVLLTATGPTPAGVTLSPSSVAGGTSSTGTVTLSRAAPAGGVVVALSSTDTSVATVPGSVTVPAGATGASFTVATTTATADRSAHVVAAANGVSQNAALLVSGSSSPPASPAVSGVTLNPASVTGGTSSSGTVTLTGAAASGGLVVALSTGNTAAASVPGSVTIAAGSTSATFTISTVSGTTNRSAVITATGGGASRTATLAVNASPAPPPATDTVSITRAEWSGGRLRLEASSSGSGAALSVYVTSTGVLLGTFSGGRFETNTATSPGNVTVRSSLGGQASREVTG